MKNIAIAAAAWAVTLFSISTFAQAPGNSVNAGVFTAAQAERGAAVFKTTCTACHDTARFTGPDFLAAWNGKPLHELFHLMHTTMPEDNPGSLKPQQYADVVAYFLQLNGYPAGKDELKADAAVLKAIPFDKKASKGKK